MTTETKIPKEIEVMLNAQRWCRENDTEHYTKEWVRLFIVIRKNKNVYELELSQTQIELIAEEFNNNKKQ